MVEVLVALAVFGLVLVGTLTLFTSNQDAYRRGLNHAEAQQNARVALQNMVRQVRMAGYDLSGVISTLAPPTAIQAADDDSLTFVADLTGDGTLDRITYRLQGSELVRDISSWDGTAFPAPTSSTVAEGIDLLAFTYLDDSTPTNNTIATPVAAGDLAAIRRVTVSLVTSQAAVGDEETFALVVDMRLRN